MVGAYKTAKIAQKAQEEYEEYTGNQSFLVIEPLVEELEKVENE